MRFRSVLLRAAVFLTALATAGLGLGVTNAYAIPAGAAAPTPPVPLAVAANPVVAAAAAGYLDDTWSVSPDGSFTDSIDLQVPDGRAGMAPRLSLNYSSSGANGLLGMGWSVAGSMSRITRCPRTIATEGTTAGLSYTKSDRFCLDGQKLIAVGAVGYGGGGYGEVDTQYRTESDTFAQIISVGSDQTIASGPDAFLVRTKGGLDFTYEPFSTTRATSGVGVVGANNDLAEWTDTATQVRSIWLLTKETDRSGNEIRYTYTGDFVHGDFRTDRITYTYNTGLLQGNRYVQFVYEDRPDVLTAYQGGVKYFLPKRIKAIEMYAPDPGATQLVWRYTFGYQTSGTHRSLLTSIAKCAPTGGCLKAKQFDWNNPAPMPWFIASTVGNVDFKPAGARPPALQVFDFDGDGTDDVLYAMGGSSDVDDPVYARLGYRHTNGTVAALTDLYPLNGVLPADTDVAHSRALDLNADGKAEYAAKHPSGLSTTDTVLGWDSVNKKFVDTGVTVNAGPNTDFGDVNGDGRVDYLTSDALSLNIGGSFGASHPMSQANSCARRVDDTNGDGRAELVGLELSGKFCSRNTFTLSADDAGNVVKTPMTFSALGITLYRALPPTLSGHWVRQGDFNGDGLIDSLLLPSDVAKPAKIAWNTGAGLVLDPHTIAIPRDQYADLRIADLNDDGRDDVIALAAKTVALLSMGDGTFVSGDVAQDAGSMTPGVGHTTTQLGDFNGDGRADIVRVVNGQLNLLLQSSMVAVDRIKAVRDEGAVLPRETMGYAQNWTDHPERTAIDYACAYPLICQRHGTVVTRQVDAQAHNVDAGAAQASTRTLLYSYEDPVADARGRGFLGFGTTRIWDPQRPAETITKYDQRGVVAGKYYPGAGHPSWVTTIVPILSTAQVAAKPTSATARISETHYNTAFHESGGVISVLPQSAFTADWEQNVTLAWGSLAGSTATTHVSGLAKPANPARMRNETFTFDAYANLTHHMRFTPGGVQQDVDTAYNNRVDDWLISLPTTVTMTAVETDHNPADVSRHVENHYDAAGRIDAVYTEKNSADPSVSSTTAYAYDQYGVVRKVTVSAPGVAARVSHMDYAPFFAGQPDEEIYTNQVWSDHNVTAYRPTQWTVVHPAYGVVLAREDANGVLDQATIDDLGRTLTISPGGQAPIAHTYAMRTDAAGGTNGLVVSTTTDGRTSRHTTDRLGRTIAESFTGFDGTVSKVVTSYDLLGRTVSTSRPFTGPSPVGVTGFGYDSLDRLTVTTEPDSSQETMAYNGFFVTKSYDTHGYETDTTVDADGRVITRTVYNVVPAVSITPITTHYEYGPFDLIAKSIDDKGNATTFGYDVLGRRTSVAQPDSGITTTTYDGLGDVLTEKHLGTGIQIAYGYDDLGRKTSATSPDGTSTYIWDTAVNGIGKMATAMSADGVDTEFRYDGAGHTVGVDYTDGADQYVTNRSYSATGRLTSVTYPGLSLSYAYNGFGYLTGISTGSGPLWTVTSRAADLSLHTARMGTAVDVTHTMDAKTGRLTGISATSSAGTNLLGLTYGYDSSGLLQARTESDSSANRTDKYTYDSVGRLVDWKLTNANAPTLGTGYTYDTIGNLLTVKTPSTLDERSYGIAGGKPHALATRDATVGGGPEQSFDYDGQGRLTDTHGPVERHIDYTAWDLPHHMVVGGQDWTFAYDAFGNRVKKTGAGETVFTFPGAFERRTTATGSSFEFVVRGGEGPVAQMSLNASGMAVRYLLADAQGSVAKVVNDMGTLTDALFYDPFGARTDAAGVPTGAPGAVKVGYTGAGHDDELGLIDLHGRVYDPVLQRFATSDPVVAEPLSGQSWNPYSYVRNSPTNLTDPSGFIYMTVDCGNSPYMPECGGYSGFGGRGGLPGGGGGGYNPGAFNPSLGDKDGGWAARQFQRDMAEFFGAAEAYESGGAHGLAAFERGDLAREVNALAEEWGPGGYMAQAAKLAAQARSDSRGYRAPKVTIGPIEVSPKDDDSKHPGDTPPKVMESCGEWTAVAGTSVSMQQCVTRVLNDGTWYNQGTSWATVNWYNAGDTPQLLDSVTVHTHNGSYSSDSTCNPGVVAPGSGGYCQGGLSGEFAGHSTEVNYWNWGQGDFGNRWLPMTHRFQPKFSPWDF